MTFATWVSIAISLVAALAARLLGYLTYPAAFAAAIFGSLIIVFGGWEWGAATAGLFLITALLSQYQERVGGGSGSEESRRSLNQVLANGLLPTLIAIAYYVFAEATCGVAAFLGCLGAVAGDTWATSSALFTTKQPRLLTSLQRVPSGTPGAVSGVGLLLSAMAGLVASILYLLMVMIVSADTVTGTVIVTLSISAITGATVGSLFDSFLGAACQGLYIDANGALTDHPSADTGQANTYTRGWRWLGNDLVNSCNAVAGALSALLVWVTAGWVNFV